MNKKKSVILNKPSKKDAHRLTAVREVPVVLNTTYLGTKLDVCLDAQKDQVKKSILKYMTFI